MPRYVYRCESCAEHFQIRHGMSEKQEECIKCSSVGNLVRVPQMPNIKLDTTNTDNKTGNLTKDFIEKNRDVLKEMKKDARGEIYDS